MINFSRQSKKTPWDIWRFFLKNRFCFANCSVDLSVPFKATTKFNNGFRCIEFTNWEAVVIITAYSVFFKNIFSRPQKMNSHIVLIVSIDDSHILFWCSIESEKCLTKVIFGPFRQFRLLQLHLGWMLPPDNWC